MSENRAFADTVCPGGTERYHYYEKHKNRAFLNNAGRKSVADDGNSHDYQPAYHDDLQSRRYVFIGMRDDPYKVAASSLVAVLFFMLNSLANLFGVGGGSLM